MEYGAGKFRLYDQSYPFNQAKLRPSDGICEDGLGLLLGLPQWGVSDWKGELYPKNCSQKNFLKEYAKRLDCVEVSSTFYANVRDETIKSWCNVVPKNFRFIPKWPKLLTHDLLLRDCKDEIAKFVRQIKLFGENLGTTILQLPQNFSTEFRRELFYFLCEIPEEFPVSIEFRHMTWFHDTRVYPQLEKYLIDKNIGMVCSDTPTLRNVFHLSFTGTKNVIRYLSDRSDETDRQRLNLWKNWLSEKGTVLSSGSELYFVLHTSEHGGASSILPFFDLERWTNILQMNRDADQGPQQDLFSQ